MINEVEMNYASCRTNKVVWWQGRPFTFTQDSPSPFNYAAVSKSGVLSLFEVKPEIVEAPYNNWSDGYPFACIDVAKVVLDDSYDWKLSLTEIVIEDVPTLQELFEFYLRVK